MANLSQQKREKMLAFLESLKAQHTDDESIRALGEIERELKSKKYGLVWEEHEEAVDDKMKTHIPVFTEVKEKEITGDRDCEYYNFLIEGDNLHSLKLLDKTHRGKVDVIYIDPPYNTGNNDFIYNDKVIGAEDGYRHSKWLSQISRRLRIARELLSPEGIIFLSIDNYEQANLKLLCDSIFGEENFIECAVVKKSINGKGDKKGFANNHDYVLCYQKSVNGKFNGLLPTPEYISSFDREDEFGKYKIDGILMKKGAGSRREDSPTLYYPLYYNPETGIVSIRKTDDTYVERYPYKSDGSDGRWTWSRRKVEEEGYKLYASPNGTIYIKDYYSEERRMKAKSILEDSKYLNNAATNEMTDVLAKRNVFETPKPIKLLMDLVDISSKKNSTILDFYAGSGTLAQAVLELNKKDGGKRRFILCTNNQNDICEKVTYQRLKTVITGKRSDGSVYSEGLPANLKYFKTDFVEKASEELIDDLLTHITEMIELEHGIKVDNKKYVIVMSEDEMDALESGISDYPDLKAVFINRSEVSFTASQMDLMKRIATYDIPDYYFDFELREAGEIW